ncbi:TetR/AcrR family transcriptional regulator [Limnochorda pilosa]|uniref:TetR family transcriptional regulator n=1 Tax=Limnochorda pilosa TaxID=1555112 RepID=A0A0K2SI79_LIMPI|nr:TetR/AcrR family transcriptional regulator [Limnochorda pilosa]BAS26790.1 TetR family transcriptional regulator [Limnochorda pilosa]
MPKEFTAERRDEIREALMTHGRQLFARHGLKRVTVDELCRAVGIAKGSFYAFFESKEDLFMSVVEREESFRDELLNRIVSEAENTREGIRRFMHEGLKHLTENELLQQLYKEGTYQALVRKLGQERLDKHRIKDARELSGYVEYLQNRGLILDAEPEVVVGLFRAVFLLTLHRAEIGENVFERVFSLLAEVLARGMITEKGATE